MLVLVFLALAVASVWSLRYDDKDDEAEAAQPVGPGPPSTLEGALVGQLLNGRISTAQYRREMGRLAERDADRHPLSVPPDASSSSP
jgi:hypothetical protein